MHNVTSASLYLCHSDFVLFTDTATTEIYTLSLHDALPIWDGAQSRAAQGGRGAHPRSREAAARLRRGEVCGRSGGDRKSTRLNSSHMSISYAVFCLKKKKMITSQ